MAFIEACILEASYKDADTIDYVLTTCNNDEQTLTAKEGEALFEVLNGWLHAKGIHP